jgi:hypothetical protein
MPIYLHYKNSISDPWTDVPSLTSVFPTQPSGSLPLAGVRLQSAPETETPCGCPGGSATDDHYILKAEIAPMPQSATNNILLFLLRFKQASYHEAQHPQFASGGFTSVELSLLDCKNEKGMSTLSFRLAVAIADLI